MSGGGKGVSSALALSNAFTNLAGRFFFLHLRHGILFLSWSNHDVQTLCCSFHFQESLIAEMFQIIHCQFLSFFSYWECSCCFWRAKAPRANAARKEGKMEKRNWLASISHRLHCWNGSCAAKKQGWHNHGGSPLSFLMFIYHSSFYNCSMIEPDLWLNRLWQQDRELISTWISLP